MARSWVPTAAVARQQWKVAKNVVLSSTRLGSAGPGLPSGSVSLKGKLRHGEVYLQSPTSHRGRTLFSPGKQSVFGKSHGAATAASREQQELGTEPSWAKRDVGTLGSRRGHRRLGRRLRGSLPLPGAGTARKWLHRGEIWDGFAATPGLEHRDR